MKKLAIYIALQIFLPSIFLFSQGSVKLNGEIKKLRGDQIIDIKEDGFGNIWIITASDEIKMNGTMKNSGHLCQYTADGEWNYFKDNKEIYRQKFTKLSTENNNIMACYTDGGVYTFDGTSWNYLTKKTIRKEFNISQKGVILSIERDTMNRTWVETSSGLWLCENNNTKSFLEDVNFTDQWTFFSNGHVYSKNGVYQFVDGKFVKITANEYENIRYMGSDNQGQSWYTKAFRTKRDLYFTIASFNNNTYKEFDFDLPYSEVNQSPKFHFMPDSSIWIISGGFVGNMKNDVLTELPFEDADIPYFFVYDKIVFDKNDNLYVTCHKSWEERSDKEYKNASGFLMKYDGDLIQQFLNINSLTNARLPIITDAHIDSKSKIWLTILNPYGTPLIIKMTSTDDAELFEINANKGVYKFIYEDSQGRIWIGSSHSGIFMYQYQ